MSKWSCGIDFPLGFACWLGNIASLCFFIVYVPQFILNYKRKSIRGFSLQSIVLKLIGASFLFVNSLFNGSPFPVFFYGFLNTFQHIAFIIQFRIYGRQKEALLFIFVPFVPLIICKAFPSLIPYTDMIKPISQIVSQIPQVYQCIKIHTTLGVSIFGQHLNFTGAILGCIMCYLTKEESFKTWTLYINSVIQSLSIYIIALWFNEFRLLDKGKMKRRIPYKIMNSEDHPFL